MASAAKILGALVFVLALGVGVIARFQTLDGRQWTTDEYFFLKSVGFILERGIPEFDTGGYYVRGLALQYLTAGLWSVFGEGTPLARLPSALFSVATIGFGYVYSRRFVSTPGALLVAAMLALSSWEIEFAGFARMYSALQCMTLAFLVVADRAFDRTGIQRYAPHAFVLLIALIHEQAVVLAPLLLLAPLSGRSPRPFVEGAVVIAVSLAIAAFVMFDFRNWGVGDVLPPDFDFAAGELLRPAGHDIGGYPIWVPAFPFWSVQGDPFLSVLAVAAIFAATGAGWWLAYSAGRVRVEELWGLWLICGAATHQFVLAGLAGIVLVLRYDLLRWRPSMTRVRALTGVGVAVALAWLIFAYVTRSSWLSAVDGRDLARAFRLTFLGFPNFFDPLVFPWRDALPMVGAMLALAFGIVAFAKRKAPPAELTRGPLATVAVSVLLLALIETPQFTTRYAFYLYPVLLTLFVLALEETASLLSREPRALPMHAAARGVALAVGALLFIASGDFNVGHLSSVSSPEVAYRIGPYQRYEDLWYQRIDFESPGRFVNQQRESDREAPVIVVGQDPMDRPLDRPFAVYMPPNSPAFWGLARERGTKHIWSAQPIVSTPEQIRAYTRGAALVWIVRSADPRRKGFEPSEIWPDELSEARQAYVGEDGRIEVVRVELERPVSSPSPS